MPRVLNVEQLETRFSSLTRARESIINLSTWIMQHSEFGEDIVEEWLAGLCKGFNALVMFYVANDVIMNCGKKRVPQFRAMFSKVFERAMALPNVKEISKDVLRVLKIWQDRGIYSEELCEIWLKELNEEVKIIPDEPPIVEEKEEPEDIISTYKKEHLFDKLVKLKNLAEEVSEKEEILKYAEEPAKPKLHLLGFEECQTFLIKINRYYATLKGFIKQSEDELAARNNVLKELNNSMIFYSSQNEDVKKVAHAYKIYGKKIKNVSKNLSAKIETLPLSENPAYVSDNDTSSPKSPDDGFSPTDDSSECDSSPNSDKKTNKISTLQNDKKTDDSFDTLSNRKLDQSSKLFQIWNEEQKNTPAKNLNTVNMETNIHNEVNEMEHSYFELENCELQKSSFINESLSSNSVESNNKIENNGEKTLTEIMKTIISKKECSQSKPESTEHKQSQKEKIKKAETINDSKKPSINANKSVSNEDSTSQDSTTKVEIVMKTIQDGTKEDLEEIDQLLEKTLKRENIKRKIEILLKSKNKRHCPGDEGEQNIEKSSPPIPDSQQITVSKSLNISSLEKSSSNQTQLTSKNTMPAPDISSKKEFETMIPIDSEQINKALSFLNFSLPKNDAENDTNKDKLNIGSKETLKPIVNDPVMVVNSSKSQSCSDPDVDNKCSDTAKMENIEKISLSIDSGLLDSCLSNELLKNILLKQKEISESSSKEKIDIKNSAEKCVEEENSKTASTSSFFTTVFNSATNEKSNLIPGLEISRESKLDSNFVSSDIQSTGNSEILSQKDTKDIIVEKKEDVNNSDLDQIKSLSTVEITIENGSPKEDSHFEEIKVSSNDTCNHSSPIVSSALKIESESKSIESKEPADVKLEIDEKNKINSSTNLIKTLSHLFECLSSNKSYLQNRSSSFKQKSMEISLENCCLFYEAILNSNATSQTSIETTDKLVNNDNTIFSSQSQDVSTLNSRVDFCTTTNTLHRPISSTCEVNNKLLDNPSNGIKSSFSIPHVNEDNFQIADMDCDSE